MDNYGQGLRRHSRGAVEKSSKDKGRLYFFQTFFLSLWSAIPSLSLSIFYIVCLPATLELILLSSITSQAPGPYLDPVNCQATCA